MTHRSISFLFFLRTYRVLQISCSDHANIETRLQFILLSEFEEVAILNIFNSRRLAAAT